MAFLIMCRFWFPWLQTCPDSSNHHPTGTWTLITPYSSLRTTTILLTSGLYMGLPEMPFFSIWQILMLQHHKSDLLMGVFPAAPCPNPIWETCTLTCCSRTSLSQHLKSAFHFCCYFTAYGVCGIVFLHLWNIRDSLINNRSLINADGWLGEPW